MGSTAFAVAGTALGSLMGELVGWLVLVGFCIIKRGELLSEIPYRREEKVESTLSVLRRLFELALPAVVATVL